MATLTLTPTTSSDGNAVIRGATDAEDGTRVILDVRPDGSGTTGDIYHGGVAGGKFFIPSNDADFSIASTTLTASSQAADNNSYVYDPNIFKLQAADTFLHLYWKGDSHVDNDGAIYGKISTDNRVTWGAEFTIIDDASGYDTRNIGGGVNPANGEIIVFYRVYNASLATNVDTKKVVGSADASTWGTPVSVSSWVGQVSSPFGNIIWGDGFAFQVFHLGSANAAWIVRSTDAFATADSLTTVTGADEMFIVPIDDDRFVGVSRDNTNLESYRYIKTSDQGVTWSALSAAFPFTDTNYTANIGDGVLVDDSIVLMVWAERGPNYDIYGSWTDKETFFANPETGWSVDNPTRFLAHDAPASDYGLNFGSPKLSSVDGHEYTAVMFWYQQAGLASDEFYVETLYKTLSRL